jgi:Domain of unknown function (DUF5666)
MLTSPTRSRRRSVHAFLSSLLAAVVLSACGGGGSDAGSTDTRSAFASGPITGFGSIIVNGVRFDDSSASISDDDGNSRRSDDLRLGMVADVSGSGITNDGSGSRSKARSIRFGSEIVGPVFSVAADGKSLVVLGQTVQVTATTLFDDRLAGGLGGLVAGTSVVEVHGLIDAASGAYVATRIEPESNPLVFKLRGAVSNIDKTARTFKIGSGTETISYEAIAATVPSSLDNGVTVRVKLQTTPVAGKWIATAIDNGVRRLDDHDEAELKGTITATTFAVDKKFSVNGLPVDASNATFPKGTAGIVLGARVEVKGSAVNGVILATRVKPESDDDRNSEGFELHGSISALDAAAKTFALRGVTVDFSGTGIEYKKGTAANLVNGRNVEVKGILSADGTRLTAVRINFED